MERILGFMLLLCLVMTPVHAGDDGMVHKKSAFDVKTTLDRLENILKNKGITIVTRWRHDAAASKVQVSLRPTEILIFGNPKMGSHLMTSQQTAGLDLPMKALAWQDDKGQVWLSYNHPAYLARRHGIQDRDEVIQKMAQALDGMTTAATTR